MIYKSEDIKKINSMMLLEKLYEAKSATMLELENMTQFSQSAVRSIIKELEKKNILVSQTMDSSTGGRCPVRYTFSNQHFQVLSIFIDEGSVEIKIKDALQHVTLDQHVNCELNVELEKIILDLAIKHQVNCISIASSGVVQEDCFYNDHGEYMEKQEIALHLKKQIDIPIIIENDVKCMMMGVQAKKHVENLAYIYMSKTGVGSAYYVNQHILKGHQSFSGELGLLPYHKKTINEWIASGPDKEILEDIYVHLIASVALTIDPENIILAGKTIDSISMDVIQKEIELCLSKRYRLRIETSSNALYDAFDGLHYRGILKLFDVYTNYERGNKHG